MGLPSTAWAEMREPDEAERFSREADILTAIQRDHNAINQCPGKAFHRKQLFAAKATFEVLGGLPEYARFGAFSEAHTFDSRVRLSNGSWGVYPDEQPDIRGFAIKVLGVDGEGVDGSLATAHHILMVQTDPFGTHSLDFIETPQRLAKSNGTFEKVAMEFHGFANSMFHTQTPFRVGPYAARGRLVPHQGSSNDAFTEDDLGGDVAGRLPLTWDYQLQFFVNETDTPIEDATEAWDERHSPYLTVARLRIPKQTNSLEFAEDIEKTSFLLWDTLKAHMPLGEINRARRVVMQASVQTRTTWQRNGEM